MEPLIPYLVIDLVVGLVLVVTSAAILTATLEATIGFHQERRAGPGGLLVIGSVVGVIWIIAVAAGLLLWS